MPRPLEACSPVTTHLLPAAKAWAAAEAKAAEFPAVARRAADRGVSPELRGGQVHSSSAPPGCTHDAGSHHCSPLAIAEAMAEAEAAPPPKAAACMSAGRGRRASAHAVGLAWSTSTSTLANKSEAGCAPGPQRWPQRTGQACASLRWGAER